MGTAIAARARARRPRGAARLPHRRPGRAPAAERENAAYLPGVTLDRAIEPHDRARDRVRRRGPRGARRALQQPARRGRRDRRPRWASAAPCWWPPRASCRRSAPRPTRLRGRARARARGGQPGRSRARARGDRGRARRWCVATRDPDLRRQLREVLDARRPDRRGHRRRDRRRAGRLRQERRRARVGRRRGARRQPGRRRRRPRLLRGARAGAWPAAARSETFAGLAGAGDLVATAIAEGSRNRRAGELVGAGVPRGQVEAAVQQTAESLATVPLLDRGLRPRGHRGARSPPACAGCSTARPRPSSGSRASAARARSAGRARPERAALRRLGCAMGGRRRRQAAAGSRLHRALPGAPARRLLATPTTGSATTTTPRT